MTPEQFQALVKAYKEHRLTEAEWLSLREALADGTYDHLLEEDIRQTFDKADTHPGWDTAREEKIWKEVNREGPANWETRTTWGLEEVQVDLRKERKLVHTLRWAAAAVLILLAGAGSLYFYEKQEKPIPFATVTAPVPPGSNKAWLVLGDGQRVTLDSLNKPAIPSQGGVQVLQPGSGLLTYTEGKESETIVYNTITTPRGGQYQLVLADGTRVWLNAASSLRFPTAFQGSERKVELTGEAYFEVKHNSAQPFRVAAGGHVIEDIGTSFNINTYDDEPVARITLIEGSARVTGTGKRNVTLKPGQQAQWQSEGETTIADNVDMEDVIAWKNGQISFANEDFPSLMRQIARWYDVNIHYTGAVPKTRFFGILNRNIYLSSILEYLQKNGAHIRQEGKDIIVSP